MMSKLNESRAIGTGTNTIVIDFHETLQSIKWG